MLSFDEAIKILGSKQTKKIGNNTVLSRTAFNNCIKIILHKNPIIFITKSSGIRGDIYYLDNCGYSTVTTKRRLNKYGPVSISQKDFVWYTKHGEFNDGQMFYANGEKC